MCHAINLVGINGFFYALTLNHKAGEHHETLSSIYQMDAW